MCANDGVYCVSNYIGGSGEELYNRVYGLVEILGGSGYTLAKCFTSVNGQKQIFN